MSGYIGPAPVPQSTQTRQTFTATSGQTSFATIGYVAGGQFIQVYLNGVLLKLTDDYTAANGSDIVLTSGAATGDILEFISFADFTVNNQNFTGTTTVTDLTATGDINGVDAILSGGVYLGGTGSANKLDDYEEGNFTPVVADSSSGGNTASGDFVGRYTLVGNQCTIWVRLVNINPTGLTGGNSLICRGLPFTSSANDTYGVSAVMCDRISFDNYVVAQTGPSDDHLSFRTVDSSAQDQAVLCSDVLSTGSDMLFTLTYRIA